MTRDVDILHHLGLVARDLGGLCSRFGALGFTLTPLSLPRIPLREGAPPEPVGAGNRCAIFHDNYLELLGVVDTALWASISTEQRGPFDFDRPLSRYEGLHVLHLGADDLDVVRERLNRSGLHPSPIRPFQRPVETPDGPQMMRARALSLPRGAAPEALLQIAQHETPELVLQPRYMQHENGAQSIVDVIMCVADVGEVAARFAAIAGKPAEADGTAMRIDLGRSSILVVHPQHLGELLPGAVPPTLPFLAGFTLAANLDAATAFFARQDISVAHAGAHLIVGADQAGGASIRFRSAKAS